MNDVGSKGFRQPLRCRYPRRWSSGRTGRAFSRARPETRLLESLESRLKREPLTKRSVLLVERANEYDDGARDGRGVPDKVGRWPVLEDTGAHLLQDGCDVFGLFAPAQIPHLIHVGGEVHPTGRRWRSASARHRWFFARVHQVQPIPPQLRRRLARAFRIWGGAEYFTPRRTQSLGAVFGRDSLKKSGPFFSFAIPYEQAKSAPFFG